MPNCEVATSVRQAGELHNSGLQRYDPPADLLSCYAHSNTSTTQTCAPSLKRKRSDSTSPSPTPGARASQSKNHDNHNQKGSAFAGIRDHVILFCKCELAFVKPAYWTSKTFIPREPHVPPYLTFLGSKQFGYVYSNKPQQNCHSLTTSISSFPSSSCSSSSSSSVSNSIQHILATGPPGLQLDALSDDPLCSIALFLTCSELCAYMCVNKRHFQLLDDDKYWSMLGQSYWPRMFPCLRQQSSACVSAKELFIQHARARHVIPDSPKATLDDYLFSLDWSIPDEKGHEKHLECVAEAIFTAPQESDSSFELVMAQDDLKLMSAGNTTRGIGLNVIVSDRASGRTRVMTRLSSDLQMDEFAQDNTAIRNGVYTKSYFMVWEFENKFSDKNDDMESYATGSCKLSFKWATPDLTAIPFDCLTRICIHPQLSDGSFDSRDMDKSTLLHMISCLLTTTPRTEKFII